jgi:hypothetical protein
MTKKNEQVPDSFESNSVVSSSECTGMMQSFPENDDEIESYQDIYDVPKQGTKEERDKNSGKGITVHR